MSHGISARCYLWCLQHGTVLGIIKNQGPEILDRHVGRQGQGIAFASIKIFMFLITKCKDILGTNTHHLHDHGRSICCGQVEESSPCINVPATRALVNQPFVIATDKGSRPLTLFTYEFVRKHLQSSGNSIHKQIWPEVNIDVGCRMLDTTPTSQMVDEKRIHETWKKSSHLENSKCHFASAKGTVELDRFITWCKAKCAGRGVPNSHPFFKKSLHSRIWLEGLSFPGAEISKSGWTAL